VTAVIDYTQPQSEEREITRESIRKFAVSTGALDPVHFDVEAARAQGYRDLLAPAYFFVSLGLSFHRIRPRAELADTGLPLDDELAGRRVVAGETNIEWFGDIFAGDTILVTFRRLGIEHKVGRSGPLDLYHCERTYSRDGQVLFLERYVRMAR
jgi:acyl dehydratase